VEIFMEGYERLKSVGGGGRYDALASDGRTTYPGVGVSFGVSRTLVPLIADGVLAGSRPVPSAVLVALNTEDERGASTSVAGALRARGIACEVAPTPAKFGKQIRFAERRGIPFVWFVQADGSHQVKDIRSGEQVDADPSTWTPPDADLRPTISSTVGNDTTEHNTEETPK
jgi:histidyl-tRNA synthetase